MHAETDYRTVCDNVHETVVQALLSTPGTCWVAKGSAYVDKNGRSTQYFDCRLAKGRKCPAKLRTLSDPSTGLSSVDTKGEHFHEEGSHRGVAPHDRERAFALIRQNAILSSRRLEVLMFQQFQIRLERRQAEGLRRACARIDGRRNLTHEWSIGEIADLVEKLQYEVLLNVNAYDDEDKSIIKFNVTDDEWSIFVTTKKFLRTINSGVQCLSTDFTHGISSFDCKLGTVCTVDGNKKLFPLGYLISQSETSTSYTILLQMIRLQFEEIFLTPFPKIQFFVSDAFQGLGSVFRQFDPDARKLACFFHLQQRIRSKPFNQPADKDIVMADIRLLQRTVNEEHFTHALEQFKESWAAVEYEVVRNFVNSYCNGDNSNWKNFSVVVDNNSQNVRPGTTNNISEVCHSALKRGIRESVNSLKRPLDVVLQTFMNSYCPFQSLKLPEFLNANVLGRDIWSLYFLIKQEGYRRTRREYKTQNGILHRRYYRIESVMHTIIPSDTNPLLGFTGRTFFVENRSHALVYVPDNCANWSGMICNCSYFTSQGNCSHIIAISELRGVRLSADDLRTCPANMLTNAAVTRRTRQRLR